MFHRPPLCFALQLGIRAAHSPMGEAIAQVCTAQPEPVEI